MTFDTTWRAIRDRCVSLDADAVLLTPESEDPFVVDRVDEDWIAVRFLDDGDRTLWRDQFAVLADRVTEEPLELDALPPGVGPYVTVLSLAPGFEVDESATELSAVEVGATAPDADAGTASDSPFLTSRWEVRRPPERVHDDALLVADFLERHDVTDVDELPAEVLVDLYVLLSDVQWGADEMRRDASEELLDHIGPEGRLHGQFGTVSRARRERRQLKDEDEVLAALDAADVPRDWVLGVDEEKLDVVIAATDVAESDVYDVHETYYVQKTGVESDEKRSRLQGLRDRLAELEDEDAEEIRDEISTLESRIDDMLATG